MADICYMPSPTPVHIANFREAASDLRKQLARIGAPATTWSHVFLVHLPQFLAKWGTLFPFLCHGVEGRHRFFKQDIHLSTGAQWDRRGASVGFSQVLKLDRISWALRSFERLEEKKRYQAQRGAAFAAARDTLTIRLLRFTLLPLRQNQIRILQSVRTFMFFLLF